MTIEQAISMHAVSQPEKIAISNGTMNISYSELWERILAARDFFLHLPSYIKQGNVLLAANKQVEFFYAYFGAHLADLVVAPVDSEINPTRLDYIQNAINPICVIGLEKQSTSGNSVPLLQFAELPSPSMNEDVLYPDEDAVADVLFTTGTTGAPKCVPLTYGNEIAAVENINTYVGNTSDDIELLILPISHSFGLGRVRCCICKGQTIYLLNSITNVKRFYRTIEERRITGFAMVPAIWKFIEKMSGERLGDYATQLRYIEMGSAYLSVEDKSHLAQLLPNTRIAMHYGLTEASRSAFLELHDKVHLVTVGKAAPNVKIKIFDANGSDVTGNGEGEICVQGKHVIQGYMNADNSQSFYGEYFRTGDYGIMDKDGYVTLKSRLKELINVGGKKVAPTEVEEQLLKLTGVKDCACVPMPDPDGILGEVVKACVVLEDGYEPTDEELNNQLMGKLELYKMPVQYEWVDEIPRTYNGKIQRARLA